MKLKFSLIALTTSLLAISTVAPPVTIAQPNPPTEPAETTRFDAAKAIAAKITVRIKIGDGGGSGVLMTKKGNTYMVLTNAHVVREETGITIQTPDGKIHTARRVKDTEVGNFDLALLEFTSTASYQLAKLLNLKDNQNQVAQLNEGREIFSAGFPYDSKEMRFVEGEVTQLSHEPFRNGTQIGYGTKIDLKQGMSGGPILDSFGDLLGINTTLSRPVIDTYIYADGSKPTREKISQYRQANWGVPIYNLLTRLNPEILSAYQDLPKLQKVVTPSGYMAELDRKARQVTVRIENSDGNGSGVIVATEGGSYYVLTALHVVEHKDDKGTKELLNAKLTTHDQKTYTIDPSQIIRAEGTDLAIIKFTSTQPYPIAILGNYRVMDKSIVFPGGWPARSRINSQQWQWQLNPGTISSQEKAQFRTQDKESFSSSNGSYDLIYSSVTYGGMSGGPVFDNAGQVIGIHGRAEGSNGLILGDSLGISIKTFLGLADKLNVNKRNLKIATTAPNNLDGAKLTSIDLVRNNIATPTNDGDVTQWILYGNQLYRSSKYPEAIKAFDRAITLNPASMAAQYGKGLALKKNKNLQAALIAFDRSIALVPSDSQANSYYLWKQRAEILESLKRYQEALVSIDRAIQLEPNDILLLSSKAYIFRSLKRYPDAIKIWDRIIAQEQKGWVYLDRAFEKLNINDIQGAIADINIGLKLNPQDSRNYIARSYAKASSKDYQGAIADINMVMKLDPQNDQSYIIRGEYKHKLTGSYQDQINDYNLAIKINPQNDWNYGLRGNAKYLTEDFQGANDDYNTAIKLNPYNAKNYDGRSSSRSTLGDHQGAIDDANLAISMNPENASYYDTRGKAKKNRSMGEIRRVEDYHAAIADFNIAISLDPQNANFYTSRSTTKSSLGDHQGAIDDINIAIKIDPKSSAYYSIRAWYKSTLGDNDDAMADYNLAININDDVSKLLHHQYYGSRGDLKAKLGDNKGAMTDYDLAIKLKPNDASHYLDRADFKAKLGDNKGALADYDLAIKLKPNDAQYYLNRRNAKLAIGDNKGALADFAMVLKIYPAKYYLERGGNKTDAGNHTEAIADYNMAIKIDPTYNLAYVGSGLSKSKLGDTQGALADYNMAIEISPQFADYYLLRSSVRYKLGDKKGSLNDLDKSIKLDPKSTNTAYYKRGVFKEIEGDDRGAVSDYTIAIQSNLTDPEVYIRRGNLKRKLNQYKEAIADFDAAIKINPKQANTYLFRGMSKYKLQDKKGAMTDFDRAIEINPKEPIFYSTRGVLKQELGNDREALIDFTTVTKLNPKDVTAYLSCGIIKYKLGDIQGALSDYDRAIVLDPKNDGAYGNAAFLKYDLGDVAGAIDYWRKSLSFQPDNSDAQMGLAVALYKQGNQAEAYKLATAAMKKEKRSTNLDFLRKEAAWSEIIIKDAVKFFQTPQILGIR